MDQALADERISALRVFVAKIIAQTGFSASPRTKLLAGVVLLNLFVIALASTFAYNGYRQAREHTEVLTRNLAKVLESKIIDSFQRIDVALWDILDELERQGTAGRSDHGVLARTFERVQSRVTDVDGFRIADASGLVVAGNGIDPQARISVADRPHFVRLRDDPKSGLIFSRPQVSRVNGKVVLVLARRVPGRDESFGGMVFAAVTLDRINQLFASLDLGPGGAVILRDEELGLVTRYPDLQQVGLTVGSQPISKELRALFSEGKNNVTFYTSLASGNYARVVTLRKIGDFPFYLTVGVAESDYLAVWREDAANLAGLVALFMAATLLSAWLLYRAWLKQQESTATLQRQEALYHELVENTSTMVVRYQGDSTILFANSAYAGFFDHAPEELVGKRWLDFIPDAAEKALTRQRIAAFTPTNPTASHQEHRIVSGAGTTRWTSWTDSAFFSESGRLTHLQSVGEDITERKRIQNVQSARLRLMEFANSHTLKELLVATLDEAGVLTDSPIGFYHFMEADQQNLSLQAWSTRTTQEYCHAAGEGSHYNVNEAGVWVECVRLRRAVIHNDYAALTNKRGLPPGHAEVLREMVVPVFRNDLIVAILGVGNKATVYDAADLETVTQLADLAWDFAESKRANEALRESEERWKFALEGSGEGVWDWNVPLNEVNFSHHWKQMLGYADDQVGNHFDDWKTLIHPDDRAGTLATIQAYFQGSMLEYLVEYRMLCRDGGWKWILARGMIVRRAPDGAPLRMIGTHSDITERKEAELQISFMAYHDRLTGLPNRALFFDRFSQAISQARRNNKRVALLFLDLDGFKPVNDTYGHEAGDIVLKIVSERMLSAVRAMDTVARMGGDEFVVILGELDGSAEVEVVARKLLDAISQDITLPDDQQCKVGASIGISVYPDNGTEMDTLLVAADSAMYQSKHGQKGTFTFVSAMTAVESNGDDWASIGEEHLVGVAEIDAQHRHIAKIINDLNRAIKRNDDQSVLKTLLDELTAYTSMHFKTEHDLMERYGYPNRLSHDVAHGRLLADALHFKTRLYKGGDLFVLQSIKDWLLQHIVTEDRPLGEFLQPRMNAD